MKQTTISTPLLSPFNGKTIVLELGREIGFKAKQELINYLREQKAYISYILTASTDYVLITNNVDSYKTRRAKQLGLPLVNVEYVYEYRRLPPGQTSIDISKFIIKSIEDQENFTQTGTISITGSRTNAIKINKFDLTKIKIWNSDDINLPRFDELTHCEIGKWAIFKETNDNSNVYFVLELQVIPEQYYDRITSDYRLRFRYEKQTIVNDGQQQNKKVLIQYAFSDDPNEQQQLFATYYHRVATMSRVTRIREMLPDKLGSKLLLRSLFTHRIDTQILDENACQLIESIWLESIGDLNKILSVPPESITLKTIIEAEAALLELKTTNDPRAALRFYSLIPHRSQYTVDLIKNRRVLTEKIDLCQMLRDMLTVNELTNWNVKAPIEAKYRALKCHIETIDNSTPEFNSIAELIQSSTDNGKQIVIHQIFNVTKQIDALNFCTSLSNQRQLFHGSKYANFLGILSRGLAMPKMVVEELGVVRTDIGCLGYGLYFSDSASTSLKYTTASTTRPGRRLLCICQVALGESANYYSFAPTLVKPHDGFHSTHGVKRTEENNSMFTDNEYAIYQLDQQRLLYIVEVSWAPNDTLNIEFERLPIIHHQQHALKLSEHVEVPMTIEDEVIEIAEQDYGLINPSSGKLVPLKSFHIRAQIVDTTVEVVLYQVYHNTSSIPIEAKYVFPLDENSTVCGFEAHINNKIIKGVVKEKEQAKQEYREAIEKGHGAYLMHQEQAQVFSVAVGNLPANNEVIIKITYVAELEIENDEIIFRLPAKMASWQSKQAIESKDQSIVRSIGIIDEKVEFSFKASIRMPYEIIKLFSPTHRLRRKLTDCIAMIELIDNVLLDRDFVLSITLRSANLPRISIETLSLDNDDNGTTIASKNDDSQACMLTFYPRFETLTNSNEQIELIFIIDVSNSMDGSYVQQAKQLAHLFLTNMKFDDRNIYFNIVTFGSDNDECFPISTPTTKENLDKAKHFVLHSLIHRGNTDLSAVLHRYSLLPALPTSKFGRQFIILSDGHIHDLQSILVLLEHQSTMRRDRIFACSIGNVANKHGLKQLVNGASGGGLTTVFDSNYRSKWKTKVLNILEQVRQPCVTNISINWHGHVDEQQKFNMQAPKIIRSLFNGMRLSVYRFIQNCHKATLTATIDGQEFVTTVFSSTMTTTKGRILHCLTARAIIDDYDNGLLHVDESENELMKVQYKQDLIDLSIKHSVVSAYTSFVAIEERDAKTDVKTFQPGVRLLDVMLDRNIDLLPYIGWDGDVSNLDTIKQKLIDERIPLESASIQSKKESIVDIEKLCEKISYRAGGDAKFDMMMTIIRTYRYALNEHEKANEIENKMRNDLKTEMISATTEERQTLQQRCQTNNLIIISDDDESSVDFDGKTSGLTKTQRLEKMRQIMSSLGEAPTAADVPSTPSSLSSSSSSSLFSLELAQEMISKGKKMTAPGTRSLAAPGTCSLAALSDSDDEGDDMGFGCFDDIPTASYSAPRKMRALEKESLRLQPESDDDDDDNMFDIFGDYVPAASCPASEKKPTPEEPSMQQQLKLAELENEDDAMDWSILDTMNESSYIDFTQKYQSKLQLITSDAKQQSLADYGEADLFGDGSVGGDDLVSLRFTVTRDSSLASHDLTTTKIIPAKQLPISTVDKNLETKKRSVPAPPPLPPVRLAQQLSKSTAMKRAPSTSKQQSSLISAQLPRPEMLILPSATISHVTAQAQTASFSSQRLPAPQSLRPPPPPPPRPQFMHHSAAVRGRGGMSRPLPPPRDATKTSIAFSEMPPPAVNQSLQQNFSLPQSTPRKISPHVMTLYSLSNEFVVFTPYYVAPMVNINNNNASFESNTIDKQTALQSSSSPISLGDFSFNDEFVSNTCDLFDVAPLPASHLETSAAPPPPPPPPPPPLPTTTATTSSFLLDNFDQAFVGGSSVSNQSSESADRLKRDELLDDISSCIAPSSLSIASPKKSYPTVSLKMKAATDEPRSSRGGCMGSSTAATQSAISTKASPRGRTYDEDKLLETRCRNKIKAKFQDFEKQDDDDKKASFLSSETTLSSIVGKRKNVETLQSKMKEVPTSNTSICDLLLLDVCPLGFGIEDIHGQMHTLIRRNTTIPTRTQFYSVFTNAYAYQTTATIRIFEGEHNLTKYNTLLGEFSLSGLTTNYAAQTLEISIRMDLDANGILHVDAEEARSAAKASFNFTPNNQQRLTADDIARHITYVNSDPRFTAKSVYNRIPNDPLYMLDGQTESIMHNFSGEPITSRGQTTSIPLFSKLKDVRSTTTMIEELFNLQSKDGSFTLNKELADVFHIDFDIFHGLENYLRKQGFNSLALNIRNDILRLIGTGVILIWLVLQTQASQQNTFQFLFNIEQIKVHLCSHLPANMSEQINKAIEFYQQTNQRNGIYCTQLELSDSSWNMFIQRILIGIDPVDN
ncbi:unnamed protein product [Rotaria sordida]|uniref:Poly [ADP-ribose] polymerase n=1 Tax=Rotaria sordida TaxID=392033 RepID=A0A815DVH9_9BILA|nr:unnamed protein product [Rotaria sordida]CAF1303597.1 unnamed protein product [Rotaria sordida]